MQNFTKVAFLPTDSQEKKLEKIFDFFYDAYGKTDEYVLKKWLTDQKII